MLSENYLDLTLNFVYVDGRPQAIENECLDFVQEQKDCPKIESDYKQS